MTNIRPLYQVITKNYKKTRTKTTTSEFKMRSYAGKDLYVLTASPSENSYTGLENFVDHILPKTNEE